jgi:hypothetical protein
MHPESDHLDHLSVEQIAAHIERRLLGAERDAVVAHLVECSECRQEYVQASEVLAGLHRTWRGHTTGLALAAAAVLIVAFMPRSLPTREVARVDDAATQRVAVPDAATGIRIASPADGDRLTGTTVTLAWHPGVPADALYRVTVQTADGSVIWKQNTSDTTVTVSASVRLTEGEVYYWVVDALHADGRSDRSAATAFRR